MVSRFRGVHVSHSGAPKGIPKGFNITTVMWFELKANDTKGLCKLILAKIQKHESRILMEHKCCKYDNHD